MTARDDDPAPLAGDARRIVDAARGAPRLSPERKARVRGRVMAAVAAGAAATAAASEAAGAGAGAAMEAGAGLGAGATKAAGLSLFAKIGLSVALVTAGAAGLLWSRAQSAGEGSRAAPGASTPAVTVTAAAPPPAVSGAPTGAPAAPEASPEAPEAASSNTGSVGAAATGSAAPPAPGPGNAAPDASAAPADTLPEENKLLAAAQAALARGDSAGALALLDEHAARFPRGALAPERRAARAMALCKQGRTADGQREADALYGADSKSPVAEKIRRACAR